MTREEARQVLEKVKALTELPFQTGDAIDVAIDALTEDKEKPKRWKPENGQDYWYVTSYGVNVANWDGDDVDEARYKKGKCYCTEEDCMFAAECELVAAELQNYADEHNEHEIVWGGDNMNFYLYYDHSEKIIKKGGYCVSQHKDVYFTSKEIAESAIEAIGEERLKKYYFKVE